MWVLRDLYTGRVKARRPAALLSMLTLLSVTTWSTASVAAADTPVARINFQTSGFAVPTGYVADIGAAFDSARGHGWVQPGSSTPIDMTLNTRLRSTPSDPRLRTFVTMQGSGAANQPNVGAWEYAVPAGDYRVTLSVGDGSYIDSIHRVTVEGIVAIAGFTPNSGVKFASATVVVPVADGKLTVDAIGGTNTKIDYIDIDTTVATTDTTPPVVTTSVLGLQRPDGSYNGSASVAVQATDSQSGNASTTYSVDGAAFQPYTVPIVLSLVGSYRFVAQATDTAGNVGTTDRTVVVSAYAKGPGALTLENLDLVPFPNRLVMSRIETPESGTGLKPDGTCCVPANFVHDTSTVRLRNTGSGTMTITGLAVSGAFELVMPPALPAPVAPGAFRDVKVRFVAHSSGSGGVHSGQLSIFGDGASAPSTPVQLSGVWQTLSERNREPSTQTIIKGFGYTTQITAAGQSLNEFGRVHAVGEEVLSPYWVRADLSRPAGVQQLAAYHMQGNTATVSFHAKGSSTRTTALVHNRLDGQTVLPRKSGSTTALATASFTPPAIFGIYIDGESSDPARNNASADISNGCPGPCGHRVRFWPARDLSGRVLPDTYIVVMDYSGINYDYNDNLYLFTNIRPELSVHPYTPDTLPGAEALRLDFAAPVAGTVGDKDGQGTGFTSVQRNALDNEGTNSNSYQAAAFDVADGALTIAAFGTATTGLSTGSDNTLVNGLQVGLDASVAPLTITATLDGPLSFTGGSQQAGVQLGPDQDTFVKVTIVNRSAGGQAVQLYAEQSGAGATVGTSPELPPAADIVSVQLALIADPAVTSVRGAFRVRTSSGPGAWMFVPGSFKPQQVKFGRFFDRRAKAGIYTSSKGSAGLSVKFADFVIVPGDPTVPASANALLRLDVAGSGSYTDTAGRVWSSDAGYFAPPTAVDEGATTAPLEIANTDDDRIYRTYRGNLGAVVQAERVLSYALPTSGQTNVRLRLHFAERFSGNSSAGQRVFNIEAEGRTLYDGFDVVAAARGVNSAIVLDLPAVSVTDGTLNLTLRAGRDFPSIAGIEVICTGDCGPVDTQAPDAPTGLMATANASNQVQLSWAPSNATDVAGYRVYRSAGGGTLTPVNASLHSGTTYLDTSPSTNVTLRYTVSAVDGGGNESMPSAPADVAPIVVPVPIEPVRVNAGGPSTTVGSVTWRACTLTTDCSDFVVGGHKYKPSAQPTFTGVVSPASTAIYQTIWSGGVNDGLAPGALAFSFGVPVANGNYTVRLHFAELSKTAAGQRVFNVNVEGGAMELTGFDIYSETGGKGRVLIKEYPVTVTDGVVTIDVFCQVENAQINALEILPA